MNSDLLAAREGRLAAGKERKDTHGQIAEIVHKTTPLLPRDWSIAKLEAWLVTRSKALESLTSAEKAQRNAREAEQDGETIRRKLTDAASATGTDVATDASVETLISLLQTAIDRAEEMRRLRSDVAGREREVNARKRRAEKARDVEQKWNESWAEQCSDNWLGKDGSIPAVSTVRETLKALDELSPLIQKRASLADRIEKMGSDQRRFGAEVESLAKQLNMGTASLPLDLASQIARALEDARVAEKARDAATERLLAVEARRKGIEGRKGDSRLPQGGDAHPFQGWLS